jgi:hypothetical protein
MVKNVRSPKEVATTIAENRRAAGRRAFDIPLQYFLNKIGKGSMGSASRATLWFDGLNWLLQSLRVDPSGVFASYFLPQMGKILLAFGHPSKITKSRKHAATGRQLPSFGR